MRALKSALCPLLVLLTAAAPAALAQQIGVNSAIRNTVQMKTKTDAALRPAVIREQVHIGDAVQTGANSQLQVLLLDKSVFTLGPAARMTLDKFVYDPGRKTGEVAASVARGAFRFVSGGPAGPGGRTITTPSGSLGIRGTIVEGAVGPDALAVLGSDSGQSCSDPEKAVLAALRGPGANTGGFDLPGAVDVTAGGTKTSLSVAGTAVLLCGGDVGKPFVLSDAALARLSDLLRPGGGGGNGSEIGAISLASGSVLDSFEPTRFLPEPLDIDLPLIFNAQNPRDPVGPPGCSKLKPDCR